LCNPPILLGFREETMTAFARRSVLAASVLALGLAGCSNTEGPVAASTTAGSGGKADLIARSEVALAELHRVQPATRQLTEDARAVLVFPSITKIGVGIGGEGGNGTMFERGRAVGFYNLAGASIGLQLGAQSFSQAYFFNTEEALKTFREFKGFEAGVGATAVAADFGADGSLSTSTLQKPVVVVTWGQGGLMAGVDVGGNKITQIDP
jgi:lipid-binding SYLF domain-containing protein